jgi:hypothetical protein
MTEWNALLPEWSKLRGGVVILITLVFAASANF